MKLLLSSDISTSIDKRFFVVAAIAFWLVLGHVLWAKKVYPGPGFEPVRKEAKPVKYWFCVVMILNCAIGATILAFPHIFSR